VTPVFQLFADGIDVTAGINDRLLSLMVKDAAGQESDTLTLELDDRDGVIAIPRVGAKLTCWLGYSETSLMPMGLFTVDDVSSKGGNQGQTLAVSARAADMLANLKERRDKHWDGKTLSTILGEEAAEHGLAAVISPELAGFRYDYLAKTGEPLLHFGTRLARRHDATFKIAGGKLLFVKRGAGRSASGLALPPIAITRPGNLLEWDVKPKLGRPSYGIAAASWYDRERAQLIQEKASGSDGPAYRSRGLSQNKGEAASEAQSRKDELGRQQAGGSFIITGDAAAVAESLVSVAGVREGVDGTWLADSVTHELSARGFTTTIEVKSSKGSSS
jgi:phage protein D